MINVKGKTALLTGASAGIGMATSRLLASRGARLILVARRADRLNQLSKELAEEHACESLGLPLDLRDGPAVRAALDQLPPSWGNVEILVNNAGLARGTEPLQSGAPEEWDEVIDVNVKGLLAVSRALLPGMIQRNSGHVVNLGSIAGYETYPGGAVYCATKYAVRSLTRGMKMDLQGTPIRVTSIDPGLVETEFSQVRFRGDREKAAKPYAGIQPLTPEDIAEAVVWALERPAHVNIMNMTIFPTAQASSLLVHRSEGSEKR
jgi:3-hydroxy acid dehydrogenase/malonic semialdehyde reductase